MRPGIFKRPKQMNPDNPMDPTSLIYRQFEKALKQQKAGTNPFDPTSPISKSAAIMLAKKSSDHTKATDEPTAPTATR